MSSAQRADARFLVRFGDVRLADRILDAVHGTGAESLDPTWPRTRFGSSDRGVVELVDLHDNRIVWRSRDDIDLITVIHDRLARALREVSADAFQAEWDLR